MTEPVLNIEADERAELLVTPLDALHRELGAKMVPFAGYDMPVQYPAGVLAEHLHTRAAASLFDVSHMGQFSLNGSNAATVLEALTTGDFQDLAPGRQRYTLLMNEAGGIIDDLMVAHHPGRLLIVANASRKAVDAHHMAQHLAGATLDQHPDRALLALQGPGAAAVLGGLCPAAAALPFMGVTIATIGGAECWISRSGYTGEDGYEISVDGAHAEALARALLAQPGVAPAGLGARDSLRLEAGLCLYGADIDAVTTPVEANLTWAIGKRRRVEGGFPGAAVIQDQLANGATRYRVGLRPAGRAPARAETLIVAGGTEAGAVTSGGFSPTLGAPIAMGYVRRDIAAPGTIVDLMIRETAAPATVVPLPFVPTRYAKPGATS